MCIRDRVITDDLGQQTTVILGQMKKGGKLGEAMFSITGETVSYTHLRAHETVLDLVCRLLLEKKNSVGTKPN